MFDIIFCIILGFCVVACIIALIISLFQKNPFAIKLLSVFLSVFIILFGGFFIGKFKIDLRINDSKDYLTIPESYIERDYEGEISTESPQSIYICMKDTFSKYLPDYDDPKTRFTDFSFSCYPKMDYFNINMFPIKSSHSFSSTSVQATAASVIINNYSSTTPDTLSFEEYRKLPSLEWMERFLYYFEKHGAWDTVCHPSKRSEESDIYSLSYFTWFEPSEIINAKDVYILTEDSLVRPEYGQKINDESYYIFEVTLNDSLAFILADVGLY